MFKGTFSVAASFLALFALGLPSDVLAHGHGGGGGGGHGGHGGGFSGGHHSGGSFSGGHHSGGSFSGGHSFSGGSNLSRGYSGGASSHHAMHSSPGGYAGSWNRSGHNSYSQQGGQSRQGHHSGSWNNGTSYHNGGSNRYGYNGSSNRNSSSFFFGVGRGGLSLGYGNGYYNRYGGYGGYGGYGRGYAGYGPYGFGGYGPYGYGGYGYGGYGYGGYGYGYRGGYPWGLIATRVLLGSPYFGYGFGGGYGGYGGYGLGYGGYTGYPVYSSVSSYSPVQLASAQAPIATSGQANRGGPDYPSLGESAFQAGDYEGAVYNWRHALVDDPQNGTLVMLLGQALFATGKYDEAAGAVQQGMQMLPPEDWGVVVKNYARLYRSKDYTSQVRALEASRLKTNSPAEYFLLGYQYGFLGHTKEAVRELDKVVELAPQDETAKKLRDQLLGTATAKVAPPTVSG